MKLVPSARNTVLPSPPVAAFLLSFGRWVVPFDEGPEVGLAVPLDELEVGSDLVSEAAFAA